MNIKNHFQESCRMIRNALPSRRQAGFTLLIAALVASIVLSIASAIFDIAQKQVALASLSQQSQYAFYAADTAAECALYWDIRYQYFASTTPTLPSPPIPSSPTPPTCGGQSIALVTPLTSQAYNQSCYYALEQKNLPCYVVATSPSQLPVINLFTHPYCAKLTVTKYLDTNATVHTLIHADGFNTDCTDISTSKTALERSVELNY
jgi:hypothetical protein